MIEDFVSEAIQWSIPFVFQKSSLGTEEYSHDPKEIIKNMGQNKDKTITHFRCPAVFRSPTYLRKHRLQQLYWEKKIYSIRCCLLCTQQSCAYPLRSSWNSFPASLLCTGFSEQGLIVATHPYWSLQLRPWMTLIPVGEKKNKTKTLSMWRIKITEWKQDRTLFFIFLFLEQV